MRYIRFLVFVLISALTLIGKWNESYVTYTSLTIAMLLLPFIVHLISKEGFRLTKNPNFGKIVILYFLWMSTRSSFGHDFWRTALFCLCYLLVIAWFFLDRGKSTHPSESAKSQESSNQ